jgi:putative membrane protein
MWHDYGGADWGPMIFGMVIFWFLMIGLGIAVIWFLVGGRPAGTTRDARRSARDLLDERLARGELDVEEYRARCRALEDNGS